MFNSFIFSVSFPSSNLINFSLQNHIMRFKFVLLCSTQLATRTHIALDSPLQLDDLHPSTMQFLLCFSGSTLCPYFFYFTDTYCNLSLPNHLHVHSSLHPSHLTPATPYSYLFPFRLFPFPNAISLPQHLHHLISSSSPLLHYALSAPLMITATAWEVVAPACWSSPSSP